MTTIGFVQHEYKTEQDEIKQLSLTETKETKERVDPGAQAVAQAREVYHFVCVSTPQFLACGRQTATQMIAACKKRIAAVDREREETEQLEQAERKRQKEAALAAGDSEVASIDWPSLLALLDTAEP